MDFLRFSHHPVGHARRGDSGKPSRTALSAPAPFRWTVRQCGRQRLGLAVSQYALAGATAVLVFRRLERAAAGVSRLVNADHSWSILPGDVWWFTPEFLCSAWGLGVFTSAFLIEEVESGLRSVPAGQREAALAQGFSAWRLFRYILLPQGWLTPGSPSWAVSQPDEALLARQRDWLCRADLPGAADRKL
jgi:hypothetical protein